MNERKIQIKFSWFAWAYAKLLIPIRCQEILNEQKWTRNAENQTQQQQQQN